MAKIAEFLGTILNIFSIGDGSQNVKALRFNNGFKSDLKANPTAPRDWTLPDSSGILMTEEKSSLVSGSSPPSDTTKLWFNLETGHTYFYKTSVSAWISTDTFLITPQYTTSTSNVGFFWYLRGKYYVDKIVFSCGDQTYVKIQVGSYISPETTSFSYGTFYPDTIQENFNIFPTSVYVYVDLNVWFRHVYVS